jgi:hypothetical protein
MATYKLLCCTYARWLRPVCGEDAYRRAKDVLLALICLNSFSGFTLIFGSYFLAASRVSVWFAFAVFASIVIVVHEKILGDDAGDSDMENHIQPVDIAAFALAFLSVVVAVYAVFLS